MDLTSNPSLWSRRRWLQGLSAAVLAGGPGIALAARQPLPETLTDPKFNLRVFARIASTLVAGETGFTHYRGRAYGVDGVGRNLPLYGIEGLGAIKVRMMDDGSIRFLFSEAAIYTDLASGEPLVDWTNPYTEKKVPVWHQRNGPINFQLPGFPIQWELDGGVATFSNDISNDRDNPLKNWREPAYVSGPTLPVTEHSQYRLALDDVMNVDLPSLQYFAALQSLKPWHPWMQMGSRPGRVFTRMVSSKVSGTAALSTPVRQYAEEQLGQYLQAPSDWTGAYLDAYQLFKRELSAGSWPPEEQTDAE